MDSHTDSQRNFENESVLWENEFREITDNESGAMSGEQGSKLPSRKFPGTQFSLRFCRPISRSALKSCDLQFAAGCPKWFSLENFFCTENLLLWPICSCSQINCTNNPALQISLINRLLFIYFNNSSSSLFLSPSHSSLPFSPPPPQPRTRKKYHKNPRLFLRFREIWQASQAQLR